VEIIQGCFQLDEFLRARPMDGALLDWTAPIVIELSPGHPAARQLDCNPDEILEPLASAHLLLRKLIVGPPDPKKANIVDFVAVTHRVRPFKTFVNEFIGVLMDYFWSVLSLPEPSLSSAQPHHLLRAKCLTFFFFAE
jgi:hypothetical protein